MTELTILSAHDLATLIKNREVSSLDVTNACLDRIEKREADIRAFAHLDPDFARAQAIKCDEAQEQGASLGPLHGVPVGVKDIVNVDGLPTENGLALDKGRRAKDAELVKLLRQSGAVIIGKTTTTEAAYFHPTETRNPHNLNHTPGGSSAGSAASVADQMVPLAIGSQTNGSVIRPAAFCGVVGFKPGFGQISRKGVLPLSSNLDQMGTFARTIDDAALLADVLMPQTKADQTPLFDAASKSSDEMPRLAFVQPFNWLAKTDEDVQHRITNLLTEVGSNIEIIEIPSTFDDALSTHRTIMAKEMSENLKRYFEADALISDQLRDLILEGRQISDETYKAALTRQNAMQSELQDRFDSYDAFLTPSTYGAAPATLSQTGDPGCCSMWTMMQRPAISLPLLQDKNAMPMGIQLIGKTGRDADLLQHAKALASRISSSM